MIAKIKRFFQSSRRRAEIAAEARQLMAEMGDSWAGKAGMPLGELHELLLNIGLHHLKAIEIGAGEGEEGGAAVPRDPLGAGERGE